MRLLFLKNLLKICISLFITLEVSAQKSFNICENLSKEDYYIGKGFGVKYEEAYQKSINNLSINIWSHIYGNAELNNFENNKESLSQFKNISRISTMSILSDIKSEYLISSEKEYYVCTYIEKVKHDKAVESVAEFVKHLIDNSKDDLFKKNIEESLKNLLFARFLYFNYPIMLKSVSFEIDKQINNFQSQINIKTLSDIIISKSKREITFSLYYSKRLLYLPQIEVKYEEKKYSIKSENGIYKFNCENIDINSLIVQLNARLFKDFSRSIKEVQQLGSLLEYDDYSINIPLKLNNPDKSHISEVVFFVYPKDAIVSIDKKQVDMNKRIFLTKGIYTIEVKADGFETIVKEIMIQEGYEKISFLLNKKSRLNKY
jgi:hypothetical protein